MSPWWLLSAPAFVVFLACFFALAYRLGLRDGFRNGYRRAWRRRGEHTRRNAERIAGEAFMAVLDRWQAEAFPDDDSPPERPEVTH